MTDFYYFLNEECPQMLGNTGSNKHFQNLLHEIDDPDFTNIHLQLTHMSPDLREEIELHEKQSSQSLTRLVSKI